MKRDRAETRVTPDPEGPEQISERMQRAREGFFGRVRRTFWRVTGLQHLSPARRIPVLVLGAAGIGLIGLGLFTDLSYSWLLPAALGILPLLFHQKKEDAPEDGDAGSEAESSRWP
ncbi:MAG: hypothetical protein ACFB50_18630 [Rubrobacteraceae bacterium]